jgi:hypothetical protein
MVVVVRVARDCRADPRKKLYHVIFTLPPHPPFTAFLLQFLHLEKIASPYSRPCRHTKVTASVPSVSALPAVNGDPWRQLYFTGVSCVMRLPSPYHYALLRMILLFVPAVNVNKSPACPITNLPTLLCLDQGSMWVEIDVGMPTLAIFLSTASTNPT